MSKNTTDEISDFIKDFGLEVSGGDFTQEQFMEAKAHLESLISNREKLLLDRVEKEVIGEKWSKDTYADGTIKYFRKDGGSGGNWQGQGKADFGNAIIETQRQKLDTLRKELDGGQR